MEDAVLKMEHISMQLSGSLNQMGTQMNNTWAQQIEWKTSGIGEQLTRTCQDQLTRTLKDMANNNNFNNAVRSQIERVLTDCMQTFCHAAAREARQIMQWQEPQS